jgi:hypothetical protein
VSNGDFRNGAEIDGGVAGVEAPADFGSGGFDARIEERPRAAGFGLDGDADAAAGGFEKFAAAGCAARARFFRASRSSAAVFQSGSQPPGTVVRVAAAPSGRRAARRRAT